MNVKVGATYKHYKGGLYEVIGVAKYSETLEDMIVYRALYAAEFPYGQIWVRPANMWFDQIVHLGINTQRFTLVEDKVR